MTSAQHCIALPTTLAGNVPALIAARSNDANYSDLNEHQYNRIVVVNLVTTSHQWNEELTYIYEYISMDEANPQIQLVLLTTVIKNPKNIYRADDWPRQNGNVIIDQGVTYQVVVQDSNRAAYHACAITNPTPIAAAIHTLFNNNPEVLVPTAELASKVIPIKLPLTIDLCSKYVKHMFCMTSPTQLEIFPMDPMCAITSILWCMCEIDWKAEATMVMTEMIKTNHFYYSSFMPMHSLRGQAKYDASAFRTDDGQVLIIPREIKVIIWTCFIHIALKGMTADKAKEYMAKRIKASCDMKMIEEIKVNISNETITSLAGSQKQLLSVLQHLMLPLLPQVPLATTDKLYPFVSYARMMFGGMHMASFMAIHTWASTQPLTRAHLNTKVLNELKIYRVQWENATKACGNYPLDCYRLLFPNGNEIDTSKLKILRYCAINWRRNTGSTWANFAKVTDAGNDEPRRLDALMAQEVPVKQDNTVQLDLIETARAFGMPVNEDGSVETVDKFAPMERLFNLMDNFGGK